jgi:actin-like ATPase involved in cell morphogenesis
MYVKGKGIVLREPSVVALRRDGRGREPVLAVAEEAKKVLGRASQDIKTLIASACPTAEEAMIEVKGRGLVAGIPRSLTITSEDVRVAIAECIDSVVETVRTALEHMPAELAADIVDRGIIPTGGGALLKNMDKLLGNETQLPVTIGDDPLIFRSNVTEAEEHRL